MPTRRGPDNSIRVAISGTVNTVNWANVFWSNLTLGGTPTQADLDAWTTSFAAAYKTRFAPVQSGQVNYSLARATLFLPGTAVMQSTEPMTGTGTEAGTVVNNNASAKVVSWISSVYWRGGKPRMYSPGVVVADTINDNSISASARTALITAANNFRTDINALTSGLITGTSFGFVSFFSNKVPRTPPVFFAVSGSAAHPRLGSQRRRLGRWAV